MLEIHDATGDPGQSRKPDYSSNRTNGAGSKELPTDVHFQIGVIPVTLRTPLRKLRRDYASLYDFARVDRKSPNSFIIEVTPKPFSLRHRPRFDVSINGHLQFEPSRLAEIIPCIEWSINWEISRSLSGHLQLHASTMEKNGCGIILPGESGAGKSTLAAGLLARGYRYLCDEFALIDTDTLQLQPYPRVLCVKKPAFPVMEALGLPLHGRKHYLKGIKGYVGYVKPNTIGDASVASSCPVRNIIFPKYQAGADPVLMPISRAQAAFSLHTYCFNLLSCHRNSFDVITSVARNANCFRLVSGDIQKTCDLIDDLVRGQSSAHAKIA